MKRKVNLVGNNTLTVSLPSKWAETQGIKKGDEVELLEEGNNLFILKDPKDNKNKKIDINLTGLDRTSIMFIIVGAYRQGYDEIHLKFDQHSAIHHRLGKEINTLSIIHTETNRLIGVSIIKETENYCVIRDFSANLEQEFEPSVRRIFLLLKDIASDFLKALENKDIILLKNIEEKHDTVTKFISYCLRMLSKGAINNDCNKSMLIYHILASLDNIVDVYKYVSRDFAPNFKKPVSKEALKLITEINEGLNSYYELYYSFNNKNCEQFMKLRDNFKKHLFAETKKLNEEELLLITYLDQNFEILRDLVLARMGF